MNKWIIKIYIFLSFLCYYQLKNKSSFLYLLLIIQLLMFFQIVYFTLKNKTVKIPKDILILLLITLFSAIFNLKTIANYLINIILVYNIYFLTKYKWEIVYKEFFSFGIIFNIINILLYTYFPKIYTAPKIVFGYRISKIELEQIGVASLSQIAIYSLFSVVLFKNNFFKKIIILLSMFIILIGGKLTTLLSLTICGIIYIYSNHFSEKGLKFFLRSLQILCFGSSFIFYLLINFLKKVMSVQNIFSGRAILWIDYIDYISKDVFHIFVGNGFFLDEKKISYLTHPHNQYLSILYTLGIFGIILYYKFIVKGISRCFLLRKNYPNLLYMYIVLLIQMCGDDYYVLTIEPLPLIFLFLSYNIKYSKKIISVGVVNE